MVLEEIFRNVEFGQKKIIVLLSVVKEILKKIYRRVMEDVDNRFSFNEFFYFIFDFKIKVVVVIRKIVLQLYISSVVNDIVESVFRKMFFIVTICLCENNEIRGELDVFGSDEL